METTHHSYVIIACMCEFICARAGFSLTERGCLYWYWYASFQNAYGVFYVLVFTHMSPAVYYICPPSEFQNYLSITWDIYNILYPFCYMKRTCIKTYSHVSGDFWTKPCCTYACMSWQTVFFMHTCIHGLRMTNPAWFTQWNVLLFFVNTTVSLYIFET